MSLLRGNSKDDTNNFITYGKDNLSTYVLRIGILIALMIILVYNILDNTIDYSVFILIPIFIIIIKGFYDDYKNNRINRINGKEGNGKDNE